jgi:hypothetical protein
VPEDGVWVGYLDLVEGESLEIDVRTTSGDDLTAAVLTVDGLIWDDDDRTDEVRRDVGGDFLDPYVATENMPGGRVVVMVGELDGAGGTAEVTAWIIR